MRAAVVIGSQFGDEGKGLMTDYFCKEAGPWATVVRFNGGAQAGHTVQLPSGQRHVFHHLGSGTLANAFTYLGPEFIVNPILFWTERGELLDKFGRLPALDTVRCHPQARVTTPYDMILNQLAEEVRGRTRHGSCGVGIGETVARSGAGFGIAVADLGFPGRLDRKLNRIEGRWFMPRSRQLGIPNGAAAEALRLMAANRHKFLVSCSDLRRRVVFTDPLMDAPTKIVFEGAQGLLLDQNHRFFPHVTRSNTGLTNVLPLARRWGLTGLDVTYVTRAYLTRHGAGPLPNETAGPTIYAAKFEDKTNVPHPFQGDLRFAPLNIDLLTESIRKDLEAAGPWVPKIDANIALTCVDHCPAGHIWVWGGVHFTGNITDLVSTIRNATGLEVKYISRGPTRDTIEKQHS